MWVSPDELIHHRRVVIPPTNDSCAVKEDEDEEEDLFVRENPRPLFFFFFFFFFFFLTNWWSRGITNDCSAAVHCYKEWNIIKNSDNAHRVPDRPGQKQFLFNYRSILELERRMFKASSTYSHALIKESTYHLLRHVGFSPYCPLHASQYDDVIIRVAYARLRCRSRAVGTFFF